MYTPGIKNIQFGPFATAAALQAKYPATLYPGAVALVGSTTPYATYRSDGMVWQPPALQTDSSNLLTTSQGLVIAQLGSVITTGTWYRVPSMFRLAVTGTGTLTLDGRDVAGTISTSVYTTTLTSATNQILYPFLGMSNADLRLNVTSGSLTVQVW